MARNIYGKLIYDSVGTETFAIPAASTEMVDIDLYAVHNAQFILDGLFAATASSTGLDCDIYYGMGRLLSSTNSTGNLPCVLGGAAELIFGDNSDALTMETFDTSATDERKRTFFTLADLQISVPRWIRLIFTNNDPTNECTVTVYYDV